MRTVLFLVRKEFTQIFRDRVLLFQLLVPPFIQLLVVTSAATFEVRGFPLHVIDRDRSPASRELVRGLSASERFRIARSSWSADAARRDLVAGHVGGVLEIPAGFGRDRGRGRPARVRLTLDGSEGVVASTAQSNALGILRSLERGGGGTAGGSGPVGDMGGAVVGAPPAGRLEIRTRRWFNPDADFDDYMALGVLVILVTLVGTVMTALNIAREREQGTIEQLNVTPISKGQFVAGKLIPFWVLGLFEVALGLFLAWTAFDVPVRGSLALVFLGTAIYLVTALGVGLLISTASETQQQAQFLAFFLIVLYLFLSGIFTPVASMPEWARTLAEFNPMKHFIVVVRAVLLKGAGLAEIGRELVILAGFAAVTLPTSIRVYSKTAS